MKMQNRRDEASVTDMLGDLADGMGDLVRQHIVLARHEILADLKTMARGAGVLGLMGVMLLVGYVFAMIGVGFFLTSLLGSGFGFVTLGAAHLIIGALGVRWALSLLRAVRLGDQTAVQIKRSVGVVANAVGSGNGDKTQVLQPPAH